MTRFGRRGRARRDTNGCDGSPPVRRVPWRAGTILVSLVMLASCSSSSDGPGAAPPGSAGPPATDGATSTPSGPAPVLASATGTGDGLQGASLTVRSLRRNSAQTVTLVVTVANGGKSEIDYLDLSSHGEDYKVPSASNATLIDPVGRLRYYPLRDTDGVCVCTPMLAGEGLAAGASIDLTVSFPAPPTSVRTVTVDWGGFTPAGGVPIS